jgi:hypothetical protein
LLEDITTAVSIEKSRVWGGDPRERDHLGDPCIDERIILRWVFRKWDVGVSTGTGWLRLGTGGRHW